MDKELINQAVTILSSAGIGSLLTLLGIFLTNRSNAKNLKLQIEYQAAQDKNKMMRDRGEELYLLVDKWLNGLFGFYLRRNPVMQEKLTYNQCLDLDIQEMNKSPLDFGRIDMLIDVYFPSSRELYKKVVDLRTELNEIERLFKKSYQDGYPEGTKFLSPYIVKQKSLKDAGDILKQHISQCLLTLKQ